MPFPHFVLAGAKLILGKLAASHALSGVAGHAVTNAVFQHGAQGLLTAGQHLAASGSGSALHALAAKASLVAAKPLLIYGLSGLGATIASFLVIGIVVNGVTWTSGSVKLLNALIECIRNNDMPGATVNLNRLSHKLGKSVDSLPGTITDYLHACGVPEHIVVAIHDALTSIVG